MIFIALLNRIKEFYCALIYTHDQIVAYEIGDRTIECCGRCGKVWLEGGPDDDAAFT